MTSLEAWTFERTGCFDISANSIRVFSILCSFRLFIHLIYFPAEPSTTDKYKTHSSLHFILTTWTTWLVWGAERDNIVQLYIYTATKNIYTSIKNIYGNQRYMYGNQKYIYGNQKYMCGNQNMYKASENIYMATKIYIWQ